MLLEFRYFITNKPIYCLYVYKILFFALKINLLLGTFKAHPWKIVL